MGERETSILERYEGDWDASFTIGKKLANRVQYVKWWQGSRRIFK